jgi:F-type H+-transporting ATPase subunit delta
MAAVSIRYARAFADVLLEHKLDTARATRELNQIVELVQSNDALRKVWENPSVPAEQKIGLLDAIVKRVGFAPEVRNFIAVVIDHRRVALLPQIARQVQVEINRRMGITEAEITVARDLGAKERSELESQIAQATGQRGVRANYKLDPAVLGGAVVRVGSTIYDGSVRGQLRRIKESLSGG